MIMHTLRKITVASACLLGVLTHASAAEQTRDGCEETDVLILGAGLAGITAGQALHNHSITNFIILEYNGEIGGRCRHTEFGAGKDKYVVELGANWVQGLGKHDGYENPIFQLSKQYNVKTHYSNEISVGLYDQHGKASYYEAYFSFSKALRKAYKDAVNIMYNGLLDHSLRSGLAISGWNPGTNFHKQAIEWSQWDATQGFSPDASSQLFGAASENATFDLFGDRNNFVIDQRGFNTFIHGIAGTYLKPNDPRLQLNSVITDVTYNDESVIVHTRNNKCFKGKHAISTFSLGVLQNSLPGGHAPVKFHPDFPLWKTQAITGMSMGIYTKMFMQFDPQDKFWPDAQFLLYASPTQRGYYPLWQPLSIPGFLEDSGILIVTVVTDESRRVEAQSDEQTKHQVLAVLRQMFPDKRIPEPKAFMYPRWGMTEWAYGSYSNWPPGYTLQEHQNLRANLGRLWFAGEAMSSEWWGYLHGAWYEGRDVATKIAKCLRGASEACELDERYETLKSTTSLSEFNAKNGWKYRKALG